MKSIALFIVLLIGISRAHICLISPPQRGGFSISEPGDNSCFNIQLPCGKTTQGAPALTVKGLSTIDVTFQQNYNHWWGPAPGAMYVEISYDGTNFVQLSNPIDDFIGYDMVTQTNFTVPVTIPSKPGNGILRASYVSNNPIEPPIFVACSDILIQ
eukprot:gene8343-10248_t